MKYIVYILTVSTLLSTGCSTFTKKNMGESAATAEQESKAPARIKYVIERDIPDAGKLSQEELAGISKKSCGVINEIGPEIQWVQSYVTDDKVYCVYIAPNEETIRKHAEMGGFPVTSIAEVRNIIDPTTAK